MHGLQKLVLIHLLTCLGQLVQPSDIIHGNKAPEGSMLYMASVQSNNVHVCGGFLITENFVVTASHCFVFYPTHVVLGTHNLKKGLGERIQIKTTLMYRNYNSTGQGEDIMLFKLSRNVQLGHRVQIIQLPQAEINLKENQVCQVAGWGLTETGTRANELRVVNVSVINPPICKEKWPGLPPNVTCAGGYKTNKGFCQGDSGGPLVCSGLAVGVVSFNKKYNCKYPDVLNVYTDISKYLQWIDKILITTKHFE